MGQTNLITFIIVLLLWIIGFVPRRAVLAQFLENVALNKNARQSSTVIGGYASKVVDGDTNQNYYGNSCCHTDSELHPYWEVDLGQTFLIHHILIYNRADCCSTRTHDVQIGISNGEETTSVCFHAGRLPDIFLCQPDVPMYGRMVRIQVMRNVSDILHLCEVQVMAGGRGRDVYAKGIYAPIPSARGSGPVVLKKSVRSKVACIAHCSHNADCVSVNIISGLDGMVCQLLGSDTSTGTEEENLEFWKINELVILH